MSVMGYDQRALDGVLGLQGRRAQVLTIPVAGLFAIDSRVDGVDVTLVANTTFAFSGPTPGPYHEIQMIVRQDATGGYTVTWPTTITWVGSSPVPPTTASTASATTLVTTDGGVTWLGCAPQPLATPLTAVAGVTPAANMFPYFSSATAAAITDLTPGAWTAFIPTLAVGWALGNSTYIAQYARVVGRTIAFYAEITIGSTATIGTQLAFTLPVAAASAKAFACCTTHFIDASVGRFEAVPYEGNTTLINLAAINASGTYATSTGVTSTIPFTWTTGDLIYVAGVYESAA